MASLAAIVHPLPYQLHAVGSLSDFFPISGRARPSTLSMASQHVVLYRSDEICAPHRPIVVTIDAHSTALLTIALAADRSAQTWSAHCTQRKEHRFDGLGMASDRGKGVGEG